MFLNLVSSSRSVKHAFWLLIDVSLIPFTLLVAFSLRYGTLFPAEPLSRSVLLFPMMTAIGAILVTITGVHRFKLEAFESKGIARLGFLSVALVVAASLVSYVFDFFAPRSVPAIFGLLFFVSSVGMRVLGQAVLEAYFSRTNDRKRVLIYGAGQAGIQLAFALRQTSEVTPMGFVDDNVAMKGLLVAGLTVSHSSELETLIQNKRIDRVILAIPSLSEKMRRDMTARLSKFGCEIQTLPSFVDLIEGKGLLDSLQDVTPDDLLGRDKVDLNLPEVAKTYSGKKVMVTGAGGSIGSELCRQLVDCEISELVLYEHSEYALYALEKELSNIAKEKGITLYPILGTVTDSEQVKVAMQSCQVQIVLHAAAYKHVPLVEGNVLAGVRNNIFGTKQVAEAALACGLERFILISTDKAVRPTNVMGASKRLAELVVQDFASRSKSTLFSMVRFGNVLGSSGSVIPLFQEQLARGGPLTVTHQDVTRYFMTIPEAARLVLLAGSFARGGDVFVLDMGKPVKIIDLAKSMIQLSGLSIKDQENPDGDIEVKITGLRPGEKLYEELLIGDDMLTTPHAKILRAQEGTLSEIEIAKIIRELDDAVHKNAPNEVRDIIETWVEGFHSSPAGKTG